MKTNNKFKKSIFNIKILDISLHEILWYFILFSIAGLLMETFYCYHTTGVLESRKGLIFGPFCPIYGIGATFLIIVLNKYKKSSLISFIYCIFLGILSIFLMRFLKPLLDKLIFKISNKITFTLDLSLTIFLIFDVIATIYISYYSALLVF